MSQIHYVFIAIGVVVVTSIIVRIFRDKRRTKAMDQRARSLGFSFATEGDDALVESLTRFALLSAGRSHCAWNVMQGQINEIAVTIMDFEYSSSSDQANQHIQTVVQFQSNDLQLPSFSVRPQHWILNIAAGLAIPDINFDSHPTFSKQHLLMALDEDAVRKTFRPDVLEFFEKRGPWGAAGDGDRLVFCITEKRIPPADIRAFVDEGMVLFALLKS
ncbi:MAG: hypothetical protein ACPGVU_14650 [Limisphaerales bacterium]